jgi:hypothetical protein
VSDPGVVTLAPDGVSDRRWLGSVGHLTGITWGSTMPGGDDQFAATLQVPRLHREPALAPGRIVQVFAGGLVYEGRLDRPSPSQAGDGWSLTAHGSGTYGDDYRAIWSTYTASDILTQAIGRGLRWNVGTVTGGNLSQVSDTAGQSVTEFLNAYTATISLTWTVDQPGWPGGAVVSVMSVPTAVTRLLVTSVPAAPDLVDYINVLYARYQSSAAGAAIAAYGLASSSLSASITAHGRTEDYTDYSSAGQMTLAAAQAQAASALAKYTAASFSTQFTARPGQYLTTGGVPVDLPAERAGEVAALVLAGGGFGGEIGPVWPVTFPVGAVSYDVSTEQLTITPYQSVRSSFSGLLGLLAPQPPKPKPKPPARHKPPVHRHTVPRRKP